MKQFAVAAAVSGVLLTWLAAPPAVADEGPATSTAVEALDAALAAFQPKVRLQQTASHTPYHDHGHGPSEQLAAVAVLRGELDDDGQLQADALLARPTDTTGTGAVGVRYDGPTTTLDTPNFRVHYTSAGPHAATPAFAQRVAEVMEATRRQQLGELGWAAPPSDGQRGGDPRTDIYLAAVASMGFLGYAATDPGQACQDVACSRLHGYLVIDRAFSAWPKPDDILRVVAAHEYNHLLQFGHAAMADGWWMEATAEWMAVHAEPHIDHTSSRMAYWGATTHVPLTDSRPETGGQARSYGSYVWNAWLAQRHGPDIVRRPWEHSARTGPFSLEAYDITLGGLGGFAEEYVRFATATAEWAASGIPRAERFPDVRRAGSLQAREAVVLDHTAYALYDVPARGETTVTVTAPSAVAGGVGLVVRLPDGSVNTSTALLSDGTATLTANTARAERVTVAVINSDARWTTEGPAWDHRARRFPADQTSFTVSAATQPASSAALLSAGSGRLGGGGSSDPVAQAILTSRTLFPAGGADRVVLATADRFPDALSGAALAGSRGPILFTQGLGGLDTRTSAEIARVTGGRGHVLVLGGAAAVSEQAAQDARTAAGGTGCAAPLPASCRFAGSGREHTAALIAAVVLAENPGQRALLARSDDFADAITGGAYAAASGTPVLLTPPGSLSPHAADLIKQAGVREVLVLGGPGAVSDHVLGELTVASRTRIAGADRTATAAEIANRLWRADGRGLGGALLVNIRDENAWQTALSAAVASALLDAPQLGVETPPHGLHPATVAALRTMPGANLLAVGSSSLVSEAQLAAARDSR